MRPTAAGRRSRAASCPAARSCRSTACSRPPEPLSSPAFMSAHVPAATHEQRDADIAAVDSLDYETLAARAHELRERLNRFRVALGRYFVARQPIIDLMTVCAIA